jgi:aminoglycoside 3-N-acetyltransferase
MPAPALVGAAELTAGLAGLGVRAGQDLLIHCSLRRVGPVQGGPAALLSAIQRVAGPQATLVVPAQTAHNSLTSPSFLAATAEMTRQQAIAYAVAMPAFDAASSPSQGMGAFAEHLRTRPQARRSGHPQTSFAALGPRAGECTATHDLDSHLGERSPLGWLYLADAAILLLGVSYSVCTAFHLAEYRPGLARDRTYYCPRPGPGPPRLAGFTARDLHDGDFGRAGRSIDHEPFVRHGRVGAAEARLLPFRQAVDFAYSWFMANRPGRPRNEEPSATSGGSAGPIG